MLLPYYVQEWSMIWSLWVHTYIAPPCLYDSNYRHVLVVHPYMSSSHMKHSGLTSGGGVGSLGGRGRGEGEGGGGGGRGRPGGVECVGGSEECRQQHKVHCSTSTRHLHQHTTFDYNTRPTYPIAVLSNRYMCTFMV